MAKPTFVVKVADLERGARTVSWPIPPEWLANVFEGVDAVPRGDDGLLEVELTKSGNDVMVRGQATVNVLVPCVVTLELLPFELKPEIFLMLGRAPTLGTPADRPHKKKKGKPPARASTGSAAAPAKAKAGAGKAAARGGAAESWQDDDQELSDSDAARDVYEGDQIVLDGFLREFILLELPLYPRRSDLPPSESPATDSPPAPSPEARATVDPRLLPLAELRDRLHKPEKD